MEIGNPTEDNLDIDIDLGDVHSRAGTDDYMHDDEVRADDEMADDLDFAHHAEDKIMQDEQEFHDENLYDIGLDAEGDTELVEAVIDSYDDVSYAQPGENDIELLDNPEDVNSEPEHSTNATDFAQANAAPYDEHIQHDEPEGDAHASQLTLHEEDQDDDDAQAYLKEDLTEERTIDQGHETLQPATEPNAESDHKHEPEGSGVSDQPQAQKEHDEIDRGIPEAQTAESSNETAVDVHAKPEELNQAEEEQKREEEHEQQNTQRDEQKEQQSDDLTSHLSPPIIVYFQDSELYLFAVEDVDASTCLLEDATLMHASLQELIRACKSVLSDHIDEGYALEMEFAELDLSLTESSSDATVFSLADVLDIYTQLLQNDGGDISTPFYITLSTKPSFNTRMQQLGEAVAEGKPLSQVKELAEVYDDYAGDEVDEHETTDNHNTDPAAAADFSHQHSHQEEHSVPDESSEPAALEAEAAADVGHVEDAPQDDLLDFEDGNNREDGNDHDEAHHIEDFVEAEPHHEDAAAEEIAASETDEHTNADEEHSADLDQAASDAREDDLEPQVETNGDADEEAVDGAVHAELDEHDDNHFDDDLEDTAGDADLQHELEENSAAVPQETSTDAVASLDQPTLTRKRSLQQVEEHEISPSKKQQVA